jgi:hypothetical protein
MKLSVSDSLYSAGKEGKREEKGQAEKGKRGRTWKRKRWAI